MTKEKIIEAADNLFNLKGYEETSMSDIQNEVGIARGTMYYHFPSKEAILDALLDRYATGLLDKADKIANDPRMPVVRKFVKTILSLNIESDGGEKIIEVIHKPQNVLLHQKTQDLVFREVPPILAKIIREGNKEGVFNARFPLECAQMFVVYANVTFDVLGEQLSERELEKKLIALAYHIEIMLGVKEGLLLKEYLNALSEQKQTHAQFKNHKHKTRKNLRK